MKKDIPVKKVTWLWLRVFVGLWGWLLICGCGPETYQKQADEEVYKILQEKWQPHYGSQSNYRISDVEADPNDIRADQLPQSGVISLAEAVALATAQNRDYLSQREALYLQALSLTGVRNDFEPKWFGIFSTNYHTSGGISEGVTTSGEAGFSQLLAEGTAISTSLALDWVKILMGDSRSSLGSFLSASVAQPILRGAGREIVQENLIQAERDTVNEIRSFNRYRKIFVVTILREYYDVLRARDSITNEENNFNNLKLSYDQVQMLAQAGRKPRYEVDQAQQQMLLAENRLVLAQQDYRQQLDQFKITLGLPTDVDIELDQNELAVLSERGIGELSYTSEEVIEAAMSHRLDLANTADQTVDAQRQVRVAADALEADLTLRGSAGVASRERTQFNTLEFHQGDYSLGAELDLPFERTAERNTYRRALINLMRQQRNYEEKVDDVKLEVRQGLRNLEQAAQTYRIQQLSLKLAQERVESTRMLLQAGRADTRDLLEAQASLVDSQNATTTALVGHFIAQLALYRDMGVLDVRPDGLWQEPAK